MLLCLLLIPVMGAGIVVWFAAAIAVQVGGRRPVAVEAPFARMAFALAIGSYAVPALAGGAMLLIPSVSVRIDDVPVLVIWAGLAGYLLAFASTAAALWSGRRGEAGTRSAFAVALAAMYLVVPFAWFVVVPWSILWLGFNLSGLGGIGLGILVAALAIWLAEATAILIRGARRSAARAVFARRSALVAVSAVVFPGITGSVFYQLVSHHANVIAAASAFLLLLCWMEVCILVLISAGLGIQSAARREERGSGLVALGLQVVAGLLVASVFLAPPWPG